MSDIRSADKVDALAIPPGNTAGWIFFWEGLGNLFPWNAFITASYYFADRFCGTPYEDTFENFFSITFTLSQTIGLALAIKYEDKIKLKHRVLFPLITYSTIFIITTLFVLFPMDGSLLFWLTLLSACICGLCGALLSGGLFGLAAIFPPKYTSNLMNGQALAGLTVSFSSIVTSLASDRIDVCSDDDLSDDGCGFSVNYSALAYFLIATIVLTSCIFAFIALLKLPITK